MKMMKTLPNAARAACLVVAMIVGLTLNPGASAQVQAVDEYHVAVDRANAKLWSGDGEMWYVIDTLDEGQVLAVDGRSPGWLRVGYPQGTPALVRAEEAELIDGGKTLRLTRPSSLRAYDMNNPTFVGCYKSVFFNPLPAGTELRVISELRGPNNQLDGFFVEAPASGRGYLIETAVRNATPGEVEAWRRARAEAGTAPPSSGDTPAAPAGASANPPEQPASPAQPTSPEGDTGGGAGPDTSEGASDAAPGEPTPPAGEGAPTIATPLREPTPPAEGGAELDAFDRALADLERLDLAYAQVMSQPVMEAELDELIDEYASLVSSLDDADATYGAIIDHARLRVMALELQQRVRAGRQQLAQLRAQAEAERQATTELTRAPARTNPDYAFVGRLLPSAVYTGDRLPQLYRLVSVSGVTGRTLGYIVPDESLNLETKVGSIVGVVGERATGDTRVGVIDAERIELLAPGE